jgi:hypothetical protein
LSVHRNLGRSVLGDHRETPEQEQDVKELFHNVLVKGLKVDYSVNVSPVATGFDESK